MLEIVEATARKHGASRVSRATRDRRACPTRGRTRLLFCFDAVTRGQPREGAALEIVLRRRGLVACRAAIASRRAAGAARARKLPSLTVTRGRPRCASRTSRSTSAIDWRDREGNEHHCTTCGCGGHDATIEGKPVYRLAHETCSRTTSAPRIRTNPTGTSTPTALAQPHTRRAPHARPLGPCTRRVRRGADRAGRGRPAAKNERARRGEPALARRARIFALKSVSSPGSGKTTLLVRTIEAWGGRSPVVVIEATSRPRSTPTRIRATGAPARAGQYRQGCHSTR